MSFTQAGIHPPLRASGSRERAPDVKLREAIHRYEESMDCFVACAPLRKRVALVAGNDDGYRRLTPR